jgi:glycosidase
VAQLKHKPLRAHIHHTLFGVLATALVACGGGNTAPETAPPDVDVSLVNPVPASNGLPDNWRDGVFMEIFVRAYQDSNGDGIGDFKGLTSRLDYLKALGISGIWLMPIHPSQDKDHGYAVTDYRSVAPEYGTTQDFKDFLQAAHARGIGVITDYVINHSAGEHPAFLQSKSASGNGFRDWYLWRATMPAGWSIYGSNPWHYHASGYYFGGFWSQMPDFDLRNASVVNWHHNNMRHWLNMGVDGFRFDAVGNLVENGPSAWEHQTENHAVMKGVQTLVHQYPQRFMVCEAPSLPQRYAQPDSCGSSFAFGYQYSLAAAVKGSASDVEKIATYWLTAPQGMAGFASNHDGFAGDRLADQFGGDLTRMKLAAATYLLQTPRPFIYYGEEVGMSGAQGLTGDPKLRTPMSWTGNRNHAGFSTTTPFRVLASNSTTNNVEAQQNDVNSLLNFYRAIIGLRNSSAVLQTGVYKKAVFNGSKMAFQRELNGQSMVVGFNYGSTAGQLLMQEQAPNARFEVLWPVGSPAANIQSSSDGTLTLDLPAQGVLVLKQVP